jgi:autotransporter-associated beta strand protein
MRTKKLTSIFSLLLLAGAFTLKAANGADTWNPSGTTANLGGTGSAGNWTGANTPPISGDSLVFDVDNSVGSAASDALVDNITIGGTNSWTFTSITFTPNAPAYTISTGTAGGQGPGAGFTLGTATAGTVIYQNSGSTETIKDTIALAAANQTIALSADGNLTLIGLVCGTGGITLTGTGTLTLTNGTTESYTGATIVNGGTLALFGQNSGTSAIYKSSGLTINNGGTVMVSSDNALAGSGGTLGALPVTINAGGILTSSSSADGGAGTSTHIRGLLTLDGGTLANGGTGNQLAYGSWDLDDGVVIVAGSSLVSVISAVNVVPNQTGGTVFNVGLSGATPDLDVQGSLIHGTSQGDTGIIKQGAGLMQLDGVNTYTGPTTISAGTLTITSSGQLGGTTGAYGGLVTNNGILNYNSSGAQTFSGAIKGTGVLNINNGTVTLAASNTYSGATTVASGANLTIFSGSTSLSAITMAGSTTFTEDVLTTGSQWNLTNNLTFQESSPAMVINFSNTPSTTAAPLNISGNINFATTISLTINGNTLIPTGTYPLIAWTGSSSGVTPTTAHGNVTLNLIGVTATVVQSGNAINLVVTSGTGAISWNTGSGAWNTSSPNWQGAAPTYHDGDAVTFPDTSGSSPFAVTLNSTVTPSAVTFTNNAKNYVLSGSGGIAGLTGVSELGTGTLTMSTANTYTGPTIVSNGTLTLDFTPSAAPAGGIISGSSALTLGNATLDILGNASTPSSQTFASTTFAAGNAVINFGNNNPSLNLGGAVTAVNGATVEIPATGGTVSTTVAGGAAGGVLGTGVGANDTAGFATFGASDWASSSGGTIQGLASGAGYVTTMGGTGQGQNMDLQADYTATANVGTTTIRFNTPGADTLNIGGKWVVINAILVTPNMGADNVTIWSGINAVSGGAYFPDYSSANPQQEYIWQNNTAAYLIDNGSLANGRGAGTPTTASTSYIQAGPGTVVRGPNTYTGPYSGSNFLNGGFTVITTDNGLGVPSVASPVILSGGTLVGNATMILDNSGLNPRPIWLLNQGGGLAATAGNTLTVDGTIKGGTGPLIIGIPASSANGNVTGLLPGSGPGTANTTPVYATGKVSLTGANTYTGGTVLDTGILNVGSGSLGTGGVTFNGGTLQWNSTGLDISAQIVTINTGGGTLDVNGKTVTLANSIGNGGSGALTVINSGAPGVGGLFLNGGDSYTGGTIVASGAVLGGSGTISGNVTWNSGSYATLSSSSLLTVAGTVTMNAPTVNVIASGLTTGVYTLLTATGGFGGGSTVNPTPGGTGVIATGYAGTVSISGNSIILTVAQSGVTETWTDANSDQNWSEANNWSGSFVPHRPGDVATFGTGGVGLAVNLNQAETVGGVAFNNANSYTVAGANTLTLDDSGHGAAIGVTAGTANAINTPVALNDNVTASVSPGDSLTLGGAIANVSGAETLTVNGGGTLVLAHANSYGPAAGTVGTTLGGATVQVGSGTSLGAGDVNVTGSSTLQAAGSSVNLINNIIVANANTVSVAGGGNTLSLGGVISGNGSLTGTGSGTVNVTGANNTYTGGTILSAGVLGIAADGAAAGNAGSLGAVPATATPNNIILNGGDLLGTTTLILNANRGLGIGAVSTGDDSITTGLIDAASGQVLTIGGMIATAGNIGTNNLTVNSQPGSTGTVVLGAANTFNGTNIIAGGVEQLGDPLALQDSTLFYNNQGGSLSFGTQTAATLNGLIGSQNLALVNSAGAAVALTIGANNAGGLFSGILSGPGSLIHQGSGTEVLSAATYSGGTVVEAGNVILNNPSIVGNSLDLSGVVQYVYPATMVINGGSFTSTNGTYVVSDTGYTATSGVYNNLCTLTITNNATFTSLADATGRAISFGRGNCRPGLGHFLQVGSGVGDNTVVTAEGALDMFYSSAGGTVGSCSVDLNGGTLIVNSIQQTTDNANQVGIFNFNGGLLVAGTNDPAGGDFLPSLTYLKVNVTNALVPAYISSSSFWITIANPLIGGGDDGLVKLGSGTLVLSGANTYAGLTTVSNGTLLVSGALNNESESFAVNDGKAFGALYNGATTPVIGNLTLGSQNGSTSLIFTNLSSTSAAALAADFVYLNGPSTVKVLDAANLTAHNEYPLVQMAGRLVINSGAGFSLSLPGGVSGVLTNDPSIIPGYSTLALIVTSIVPYTQPSTLTGIALSGNNLVINATGGTANAPVNVLTTTNLALPQARWTTNSTPSFDGNGNLINYTIPGAVNPAVPQQYYRLQQP